MGFDTKQELSFIKGRHITWYSKFKKKVSKAFQIVIEIVWNEIFWKIIKLTQFKIPMGKKICKVIIVKSQVTLNQLYLETLCIYDN